MAGNISVERTGLKGGVAVCKTCIHELQSTIKELERDYQNAGTTWKDQNYFKLGGIISECIDSLQKPIPEIENCMQTLQEMLDILDDAEDVF